MRITSVRTWQKPSPLCPLIENRHISILYQIKLCRTHTRAKPPFLKSIDKQSSHYCSICKAPFPVNLQAILSLSLSLSLSLFHYLPRYPPLEPIQRISGVLSSNRRQPRSTGIAGPSLPRRKLVLATVNRTFGHRLTTHNRTSPPAPPALAHCRSDPLPVRLSLSLGISLSLSDNISLSISLSPPISPSRTHSLPLPHRVSVKGKKKNKRRKNEEKGKMGRCKGDSVHQ
jgi:hypothetical protein